MRGQRRGERRAQPLEELLALRVANSHRVRAYPNDRRRLTTKGRFQPRFGRSMVPTHSRRSLGSAKNTFDSSKVRHTCFTHSQNTNGMTNRGPCRWTLVQASRAALEPPARADLVVQPSLPPNRRARDLRFILCEGHFQFSDLLTRWRVPTHSSTCPRTLFPERSRSPLARDQSTPTLKNQREL